MSHRFEESSTNSLKLAQMHSISCRLSQPFTDSHLFNQGFPQVQFTKQTPSLHVFLRFFLKFSVFQGFNPLPPLFPKCKRKELEVKTYGPLFRTVFVYGCFFCRNVLLQGCIIVGLYLCRAVFMQGCIYVGLNIRTLFMQDCICVGLYILRIVVVQDCIIQDCICVGLYLCRTVFCRTVLQYLCRTVFVQDCPSNLSFCQF